MGNAMNKRLIALLALIDLDGIRFCFRLSNCMGGNQDTVAYGKSLSR